MIEYGPTVGPGGTGRYRIKDDGHFRGISHPTEREALNEAKRISGGRRIVRTVFVVPAEPEAPPTEASPELEPQAGEGDPLAVLEGSIRELREVLATSELDGQLDALLGAEAEGRNRKGAIRALEARRADLDAHPDGDGVPPEP